jgi:hypothetical protein
MILVGCGHDDCSEIFNLAMEWEYFRSDGRKWIGFQGDIVEQNSVDLERTEHIRRRGNRKRDRAS